MSQIDRQKLEQAIPLDQAISILDVYTNDDKAYPDKDVRSKKGICKILDEEYWPLVMLAKTLRDVKSIRLFPIANEGPDSQIVFSHGESWDIQITCSHEGYQRALLREQLQQNGIAADGERHRDNNGQVINRPFGARPMNVEANSRVERILKAINAKEKGYYTGTNTLLVQEQSDRFNYLKHLHTRVVDALQEPPSNYEKIYVVYGQDAKVAKDA